MPAQEHQKLRAYCGGDGDTFNYAPALPGFAELCATSNFTFLHGASHPDELVERAARLGFRGVSIADTNTLAGVVRAHVAAERLGFPFIVGCRVVTEDAFPVCVYPTRRDAYARLCNLLTLGKRRAVKGECRLKLDDVLAHNAGMLGVAVVAFPADGTTIDQLQRLREAFDGDRLSLAVSRLRRGDDDERLGDVLRLARRVATPIVATNQPLYHDAARRPLQDALTCIRHGCTIEQAGLRLEANAERYLKPAEEMARLFRDHPDALARSVEIAERAGRFSLGELRYEYPAEPCPEGMSSFDFLAQETRRGAALRYPGGVPEVTLASIDYELRLIRELGYEAYFLTCYDIVRFARSRGILCQGRGGAANSAVCYCLGITEVDPATHSLLFERFISRERNEPPDIDIDFEHERREEVIQYVYKKYGRERAALTAEVISYRGRSAVRDIGKAMGLSADCVDALAKNLDRWGEAPNAARVRETGFDPTNPMLRMVIELTQQLVGFPRHLSQHVGGFVITRGRLCDMVPIENAAMDERTVIEWDKDDIDAMGMLKVDCLGLGMLTCIRKAFALLSGLGERSEDGGRLTIADVMSAEREDDEVYEMISRADTVGVFQIESRAQMSMLPRLKPRCFYDLVIEVAIVRPGPIQGGMVHPYLRRREGVEAVEYPRQEVRDVLERTLGVPLFQEQAMRLAIVAAGFTADQADGLRRSMAAWKRSGNAIHRYGKELISGMLANGYEREFAERCFEQIKGFSEYGFPESHAASFAILVYVSAWLKRHHPAAFAAALINSQPMGFYRPAQIVRDAEEHGVRVLGVDVNHSDWDCTLEDGGMTLRLGMRLAKGMSESDARRIAQSVRTAGAFSSVERLWRESGASVRALRSLARADGFGSMGLGRQEALWAITPLRDEELPLFEQVSPDDDEGTGSLPVVSDVRRVLDDYNAIGLSLKRHPVSFLRRRLEREGAVQAGDLRDEQRFPSKARVRVAGMVLSRQRPGTASGVVFITLEDETGIANLIVWRDTFERYRRVTRLSAFLLVTGTVERQGSVVHVHAKSIASLDDRLPRLASISRDFH